MSEPLEVALERGYLYSKGATAERLRLERAWRRTCLQEQRPYVVGWKTYIDHPKKLVGCLEVQLTGGWWFSGGICEALRGEFEPDFQVFIRGNSATLLDFPHGSLEAMAGRLLSCLNQHQPSQDGAFSLPAPLRRGLARCCCVEGMEHCLELDALYYLRECPNMPEHVVAFASGSNPVVGVHLGRFELL